MMLSRRMLLGRGNTASTVRHYSQNAVVRGGSTRLSATTTTKLLRAPRGPAAGRRGNASTATPPPPSGGGSSTTIFALIAAAAVAGGGYYYYTTQQGGDTTAKAAAVNPDKAVKTATYADYRKVYDEIAKRLEEHDEYEDGSFGPVLVRLAWHSSGTYDKETNTGGSDGAGMRFAPERDWGANSGLAKAREFLEPVKQANPWITYSDLWILGGVCALQEMQGPVIKFKSGRSDGTEGVKINPDGRLPDASKGAQHLRDIFYRMGFDDREIVALSGAHALGRCHSDRSGYEGPWTFSPTVMTNDYYKLLLEETWQWKKWNGPKQYEDKTTKSLMMLPTDMVLVKDNGFKPHVERYAKDIDVFYKEFADVVEKLFELGTNLKDKEAWTFPTLNAEERK